jgi:hypothetical protein
MPVGLNLGNDRATAVVAGTVSAVGDANVLADAQVDNQSESIAGIQGADPAATAAGAVVAAEMAFLQDRSNLFFGSAPVPPLTDPHLATPDGQVGSAAALGVEASTAASAATVPAGATVTVAGGALHVIATSDVDARALASASAVDHAEGHAIGVALSVMNANTAAAIWGRATADAITVRTATAGDGVDTISADAAAGAGTTDLGVAGAFAATQALGNSTAYVGDGAHLTLTGAGDLVVAAGHVLDTIANAVPALDAGTVVGVGAAVELNTGNFQTLAEIQDAVITGAGDVHVLASGDYETQAAAEAGAANPGNLPAAVALMMTNHSTLANLTPASPGTAITGDLLVSATHRADGRHAADASSNAEEIGAGSAVAIGLVQGGPQAFLGRSIDVGGTVSVLATQQAVMDATASQAGVAGSSPNAQAETTEQLGILLQFVGWTRFRRRSPPRCSWAAPPPRMARWEPRRRSPRTWTSGRPVPASRQTRLSRPPVPSSSARPTTAPTTPGPRPRTRIPPTASGSPRRPTSPARVIRRSLPAV